MNADYSPVSSTDTPSNAAIDRGLRKPKNLRETVIMGALTSGLYTAIAPIERVYTLMQCQNELLKTGVYPALTRESLIASVELSSIKVSIRFGEATVLISLLSVSDRSPNFIAEPSNKLSPRSVRCVFLGYASGYKGNRCFDPHSGRVYIRRNVHFQETGIAFAASTHPQNDYNHDRPAGALLAASVMLSCFIVYPVFYAHVRLLNDATHTAGRGPYSLDLSSKTRITNTTSRLFSGAFNVITKTLMSDGIKGLYRGYTITCLGCYVYYSAECAAKDIVSKYNADKQSQKSRTILPEIPSGFFILSIPALVYPVGTVSKRMMLRSGEAQKYKGSMDALTQIVRKEGVGALYNGLAPHLIYHVAKASIISAVLYSSAKLGILMSRDDLR
ncbi:hypothetical protein KSS87_012355 [Heliosperma pusillum]|nr:hypothetical protein KSS87_012355 [Heliosperma pusillum]